MNELTRPDTPFQNSSRSKRPLLLGQLAQEADGNPTMGKGFSGLFIQPLIPTRLHKRDSVETGMTPQRVNPVPTEATHHWSPPFPTLLLESMGRTLFLRFVVGIKIVYLVQGCCKVFSCPLPATPMPSSKLLDSGNILLHTWELGNALVGMAEQ